MNVYRQIRNTVLTLGVVVASVVPAAAESAPTSCLWKIEGDRNTVFLLGSVHALNQGAYPLAPVVEQAFENAQRVIFEVDFAEMGEAALRMVARGTLASEKTLEDVVSEDTFNLVVERLEKADLGLRGFDRMHPWLLAMNLMSYELVSAGYSPNHGIDMHLYTRATEAGKTIDSLENVDFQIELFASMSAEEDEAFLRYTLEELDTVISQVKDLTGYWKNGNTAKLEELLTDGFTEFPSLFERIVNRRNAAWLNRVESLLGGDERAMVVVGALHLVGEKGLPALLRARGFTVEQL